MQHFGLLVAVALFAAATTRLGHATSPWPRYPFLCHTHRRTMLGFSLPLSDWDFSAVGGYFVYTDPKTRHDDLPALVPRFGLVKGMTWPKLLSDLDKLNAKSKETGESYKLVFAARHGEGVHNVAEQKYGTKAWDEKWAMLNTDGETTWAPDPELTAVGEQQARDANAMWKTLLASDDVNERPPVPGSFWASPLARSANTLNLTFDGIVPTGKSNAAESVILEGLRENFADRHTCDARSKRSVVAARWEPHGWLIDPAMKEEDELFASDLVESAVDMARRVEDALALIWRKPSTPTVINITSHSGTMQALFRALKTIDFKPKTGGVVALVIKAKRRPAEWMPTE